MRLITENSPNYIMTVDREFNIQFLNRTAPDVIKAEVLGTSILNYVSKESALVIKKTLERILKTCKPDQYEVEYISSDGISTIFESHVGPAMRSGQVAALIIISTDITDRKKTEERIKASLAEKEVLLREIHHRVKNNLQIISSLINMISMRTKNRGAIDLFWEARNKIQTMALIHAQLYEREQFDRINMVEYVEDLTNYLPEFQAKFVHYINFL